MRNNYNTLLPVQYFLDIGLDIGTFMAYFLCLLEYGLVLYIYGIKWRLLSILVLRWFYLVFTYGAQGNPIYIEIKNRIIICSLFIAEPYGRFQQSAFGARGGESVEPEQGLPTRYGRNFRNRRPKVKSLDPSAPPDKDPVMLLNEFGQKRGQPVCNKHAFVNFLATSIEKWINPTNPATVLHQYPICLLGTLGTNVHTIPQAGSWNSGGELSFLDWNSEGIVGARCSLEFQRYGKGGGKGG